MRAGLRALPSPLIRLALRRLSARLPRNHADLVRRLTRLAPARILFAPSDVPHAFLLDIAATGVSLRLAEPGETGQVTMRGRLRTLIDLLESRIDSDTVFFTRELAVSGDTSVAVAFRNTLDGEEINLVDDALAPLGRLAAPAGRLATSLHRRVDRIAARVAELRDESHRAAHHGHDPEDDRARILAGLDDLAARVHKLENRGRRVREEA
jgi:predicted lipid carrier protein YhbT